jgi:hypothetical protein
MRPRPESPPRVPAVPANEKIYLDHDSTRFMLSQSVDLMWREHIKDKENYR